MPLLPEAAAFAWIATHPWLYPALEAAHIVGIGLLLGSLTLVELRVWGLGAALPMAPLARLGLSVSLAGFALVLATGLTMFASQAADLLANRMFLIKMVLVACAGINAAAFHARGSLARLDRVARAQTLASMGLWLGVIICGRWIAYQ